MNLQLSEVEEVKRTKAVRFGNAGHVLVPKSWVGSPILVCRMVDNGRGGFDLMTDDEGPRPMKEGVPVSTGSLTTPEIIDLRQDG